MNDYESINRNLRDINSNITGFGLGRALDRMSGKDALGYALFLAVICFELIIYRLTNVCVMSKA